MRRFLLLSSPALQTSVYEPGVAVAGICKGPLEMRAPLWFSTACFCDLEELDLKQLNTANQTEHLSQCICFFCTCPELCWEHWLCRVLSLLRNITSPGLRGGMEKFTPQRAPLPWMAASYLLSKGGKHHSS